MNEQVSPNFLFSERFGIQRNAADDWFDVLLPTDTKLFVDPFRVYAETEGPWAGAHDELISFFNEVLRLMARAGLDPNSQHWQAASDLLMFPEPLEFCLGYAQGSDGGRGSAKSRRDQMLEAGSLAIESGMTNVEHFEEMTLFQGRVGPDLISDIVCNVLKSRFIRYTLEICQRHGVDDLEKVQVKHSSWNKSALRWENDVVELPYNPWTKSAVLLVPERFLRKLPAINAEAFWEFAFSHEADRIRGQFSYDVARNVDSYEIASLARQNAELVRAFARRFYASAPAAYNLERDPNGKVSWYKSAAKLVSMARSIPQPSAADEFCEFIFELCNEFKWIVEERGSWKLLWNSDGTPCAESSAQQLFHTAMLGWCKSHDIDISPESASGRGPVDFKFSKGWDRRALVEIKLCKNTRFFHGLGTQTPIYMKSEGISCGYFMAIQYTDKDLTPERVQAVEDKARQIASDVGYSIRPVFVDARARPSASKA